MKRTLKYLCRQSQYQTVNTSGGPNVKMSSPLIFIHILIIFFFRSIQMSNLKNVFFSASGTVNRAGIPLILKSLEYTVHWTIREDGFTRRHISESSLLLFCCIFPCLSCRSVQCLVLKDRLGWDHKVRSKWTTKLLI